MPDAPTGRTLPAPPYQPDRWEPDRYDPGPCPDVIPDRWDLQAHLVEARWGRHGVDGTRTSYYGSRAELEARLRDVRRAGRVGALAWTRLAESGTVDWFAQGANWLPPGGSGVLGQYLPMMPGPATRQLYWAEYAGMSARAFEASNHNPVAHGIIEAIVNFTVGRGVLARFDDQRDQQAWDAFAKREGLDLRIQQIAGDLATYGELFLRYLPDPGGRTRVRSIDPATIYEVVTDPEDIEQVHFFHQQFQTRPQITGDQPTLYIVRQIQPREMDHYRVNTRSAEVRGRSDLHSALGWLKRLRDILTSEVVRVDMLSRLVFHLNATRSPEGTADKLLQKIFPQGAVPDPGSVIGTTGDVVITPLGFPSSGAATASEQTAALLIALIGAGTGVPAEYIVSLVRGDTRASALVATEPAAKNFERRQGLLEAMLHDMAARVTSRARGDAGYQPDVEFVFPSIATEDRSAKLVDLKLAVGERWLSHETAATMAAKELGITTYDYAEEMEKVTRDDEASAERARAYGLPAGGGGSDGGQGTEDDTPTGGGTPGTRAGIPASQNPLAASNTLRKEMGEVLREAVREGVAIGRAAPRRLPDDADFQADVDAFRAETDANLTALLDVA